MTLGEIKRRLRVLLRLNPGDEVGDDPFFIQDNIVAAADRVAQATDCYFGTRTFDTVASTSTYCAPDLYRIETVNALNAQSQWQPLYIFDSPASADALFSSWWRNDTTSDPPRFIIYHGPGEFRLYPTPSISRSGGVSFEGWMKPGQVWSRDGSGNALTLADTQECPLPAFAHEAVVLEAIYQTALALALDKPNYGPMLPLYKRNADRERGKVERDSMEYSQRGIRMRNPYDLRQ